MSHCTIYVYSYSILSVTLKSVDFDSHQIWGARCLTSSASALVDDDVTEFPDAVVLSLFVAVQQVHRTQAGGDTARRRWHPLATAMATTNDGPQHGVVGGVEVRCADHQRTAPGAVLHVESAGVDDGVGPAKLFDVDLEVVALT